MSSHSGSRYIRGFFALLLALIAALALCPSYNNAQKATKKLSKQDILDLLTQDATNEDIAEEARDAGISFQVTASAEKEIRAAGGNDSLIRVLRTLAPHTSAPPVVPSHPKTVTSPPTLMIESSPGQCQVYVDDEPVGSTSPEGRLKMTRLAAGDHRVRLALNGYQDYQETVTLAAGEVTTVAATLQQPEAQVSNPPLRPQTEVTPPNNPGQPGYLGIQVMQQQPAGARGVTISGVAPGGPADQAGLKSSDIILSVNGQVVTTGQALRGALSGHQAGEVIQVTWYNGSTTVTRQIRLGAGAQQVPLTPQPQPQPPPPQPEQPQPQPVQPQTPSLLPHTGVVSFPVAHDHGQNGQTYCVGVMTIGNGMIYYRGIKGTNGVHNFEIPLNSVREARRNGVYLVAFHGFHIRTNKGTNFNFAALDQQSKPEPPDAVLTAIDNAMGK